MAWIPPKGPVWIVSRISVLLCGDDLQFELSPCASCHWLRIRVCSAKFYQYEHASTYLSASRFLCQRWTIASWITLFHSVFPSTPFVSHLRNWAHQCILSWMQPTLGCFRLLAPTDYVGESCPALGTLSTEPSCSMRILSQLTSVLLFASKRWDFHWFSNLTIFSPTLSACHSPQPH